jgi:hypothetical protein
MVVSVVRSTLRKTALLKKEENELCLLTQVASYLGSREKAVI